MADAKGPANVRNTILTGKNSLLPPKSPFPVPSSTYADYPTKTSVGSKTLPKSNEGNSYHHRTSSESLLVDEQPSWLDDLLNEPETPVRRGHRRSSSDSFAYVDTASMSNMDYGLSLPVQRKYDMGLAQMWGSQNFDPYADVHQGYFSIDNTYANLRNKTWELPIGSSNQVAGISSVRNHIASQGVESSPALQKRDQVHTTAEKQDNGDSGLHETKVLPEKKDVSYGKMASENDTKRAKQQFAQRSRVRKLQYIAELERNVQALQAEGSEVSAELEFINQQNLILSMENKTLKQRLESLAQERLIKKLEHEVLEREVGRLRALYQQLQQQSHLPPQQQLHHQRQSSSSHRRTHIRDLDSQFASLSIKHKEAGPATDPVSGPVHI